MINTTLRYNITEERLAGITLDSPKYMPADSRVVSRILKKAGLKRAERITGTSGMYTDGYRVSDGSLHIYTTSSYPNAEEAVEANKLRGQCVGILRDAGYVVTGEGTSRHIYKLVRPEDEAIWWNNLHQVYVAAGDALVSVYQVPIFVEEKRNRVERAKAVRAENEREARVRQEEREGFVAALRASGLDVHVATSASSVLTIDTDALGEWLAVHGVILS